MARPNVLIALLFALFSSGCHRRDASQPLVVSAIGSRPQFVDPGREPLDTPSALLLSTTAQGLVRLDSAGQIEPGLAERWIVIDNGTSYIFRLRDARWNDGKSVTAEQVVAVLRRQIGARSSNSLAPFLSAIDQIVAMTPEVIEIHLLRARPDLLQLLATPEMGIFRAKPPGGSGPYVIDRWIAPRELMLRPGFDPDRDPDTQSPGPADMIDLIGEPAAKAILRFLAHDSDLVAGGTFTDWPLLASAGASDRLVHRDPAEGLFGLTIVNRDGFLADPANRTAVAEAIDRDALLSGIAPDWSATTSILPAQFDSGAQPAVPGWATASLDDRRNDARARVGAWHSEHPGTVTLRIALPSGPGANLLYGYVGASLISIGITPQRVALDAPADLRLIDAVSPVDTARWYLRQACAPCSDEATVAIETARLAAAVADRASAIAAADASLTADVAFIPLAQPLRWSLVVPTLDQWQANARAWHPLNRLRPSPN